LRYPVWRGTPSESAKHTGGRQPTFYFHLQFAGMASTGGTTSLTGRLRLAEKQFQITMAAEIDKVREIAQRVADSSGLELVEVDLRGGGKARMLRIFIDKPGGVTHEDCSNFSHEVGTIFDVEEAVPGGTYTLEVSSPGLDRKLLKASDYDRFTGSLIKLMTRDPVAGNRHFEGRLKAFRDGRLELELLPRKKSKKHEATETDTQIEIDLANVEKANLIPEF
jgi:ribosome maturation factor RimP